MEINIEALEQELMDLLEAHPELLPLQREIGRSMTTMNQQERLHYLADLLDDALSKLIEAKEKLK